MPVSQPASIAATCPGSSGAGRAASRQDATAGTAQASGPGISPARCSQPSSDRSAVTVSFAVPFRIDGHVSTMNAVTSAAVRPARPRARLLRAARNGRTLAA